MDPVQTSQTPTNNTNLFLRILLFILGGLLIATLSSLATYYFVNKQTKTTLGQKETKKTNPAPSETRAIPKDEMSNWKTYSSDQYGFSIKYPENWKEVKPSVQEDSTIISLVSNEKFGEGPEPIVYHVNFTKYKNPEKKPLKEIALGYLEDKSFVEFSEGEVASYKVYRSNTIPSMGGVLHVFFTKDNTSYIDVWLNPYSGLLSYPSEIKYVSIFNQMLTTFKFLK